MLHDPWSTLLDGSARAAALVGLAAVASWMLRHRSGAVRHAAWRAALVGLLMIPAAMLFLPRLSLPILPVPETPASAPRAVAKAGEGASPAAAVAVALHAPSAAATAARPGWAPWAIAWLVGFGWLIARHLRSARRLARIVGRAAPLTDSDRAVWRTALTTSGAPARTRCLVSAETRVPLACGLREPVVLLPAGGSWRADELRSILLHELAHLRRRDPLALAVGQVVRALYWFHPLVWLALRELKAESERACDDAVLREGERPSRYAETLLSFVGVSSATPAAALAFLRGETLEGRISGILARDRDRRELGRGERGWIALLAVATFLGVALLHPVPGQASRAATPGAAGEEYQADWWQARALTVEPTVARFRNRLRAPVRIRYAEVRLVPDLGQGSVGATTPELWLENRDPARRVSALLLAFDLPTTHDRTWVEVSIAPAGSTRLRVDARHWAAVASPDEVEQLTVQIVGVRYSDGESWGAHDDRTAHEAPAVSATPAIPGVEAAPRAETAPRAEAAPQVEAAPEDEPALVAPEARPDPNAAPRPWAEPRPGRSGWIPARVRNPEGAPVLILEAGTPPHSAHPSGGRAMAGLPEVVIANRSTRTVVALRMRFKAEPEGHAVSSYKVAIPPGGTAIVHRENFEMWGTPAAMTVQLLGVRFADGSTWGTLDSTIDARDAWVFPLTPEVR